MDKQTVKQAERDWGRQKERDMLITTKLIDREMDKQTVKREKEKEREVETER